MRMVAARRVAFISGRQPGGKLMTKRSPSVNNSLPTLEEVFEMLPTSSPFMLLMTKSAWGGHLMLIHRW